MDSTVACDDSAVVYLLSNEAADVSATQTQSPCHENDDAGGHQHPNARQRQSQHAAASASHPPKQAPTPQATETTMSAQEAAKMKAAAGAASSENDENDGRECLKAAQRKHKPSLSLIRFLEEGYTGTTDMNEEAAVRKKASKFAMSDGVLSRLSVWNGQTYHLPVVPPKLRERVMQAVHDNKRAGHFSFRKTFGRLRKKYFWDTMRTDVLEYTEGCITCAKANISRLAPAGLLIPLKPTVRPFARVGYDKMGPMHPSAAGNKYIYTLTDYCTKLVIGEASASAKAVVAIRLLEKVINTFGPPAEVITDNGREFNNSAFEELCGTYRISHVNTSAHHPQSNGQTERFNDTCSVVLRKFADKNQSDWDEFLPHAIYAYNTAEHEATGLTPYFMLYGIEPPTEFDREIRKGKEVPIDHDFVNLELLPAVRKTAAAIVADKQRLLKERYDEGRRQPEFTAGMKVMVRIPQNIGGDGLSARFRMPYIGPFDVVDMPSSNTVRISGCSRRMKQVINISRLKRFKPRRPLDEAADQFTTTDQVSDNETSIQELFGGEDQSPAANEMQAAHEAAEKYEAAQPPEQAAGLPRNDNEPPGSSNRPAGRAEDAEKLLTPGAAHHDEAADDDEAAESLEEAAGPPDNENQLSDYLNELTGRRGDGSRMPAEGAADAEGAAHPADCENEPRGSSDKPSGRPGVTSEPRQSAAAAGPRRSTRTRRPVTRLIETCPIFESETDISEDETRWCLTVTGSLPETKEAAVATVCHEHGKAVKFEALTTSGYSSHVYTTDDSGRGIIDGLRKAVGDRIACKVETAIMNKSARTACRPEAGSYLLTAKGSLREKDDEGAAAEEAAIDKAAAGEAADDTRSGAAEHAGHNETAPSKYSLSTHTAPQYAAAGGRRVKTRKGWKTSLKSLTWDSESDEASSRRTSRKNECDAGEADAASALQR